MERSEFLKLCQSVSVLPDGVKHTKKKVPKQLRVIYDGNEYYPEYLEIKFDKGKTLNIAVLHELKASCRVCVPLEDLRKVT